MVDKAEKVARMVLWLVFSLTLVVVPLRMAKSSEAARRELAAREKETAEAEVARKAAAAPEPRRVSLREVGAGGNLLQWIEEREMVARVQFTNVSRHRGVLCIAGTAKPPSLLADSTRSIPACHLVEPYESVSMKMQFSGEFAKICGSGKCELIVDDVRDAT